MSTRWIAGLTVALLTLVRTASATNVVTNYPGTPTTNWNNSGAPEVIVSEGGGSGVQPLIFDASPFSAFPGDVVFLIDPNGGTNPTNWEAVLRLFNPNDLTGTNGLAATEYETFFPTNESPSTFAGFQLFTNSVFTTIGKTNADGSLTTDYIELGPDGGITNGQEALLEYTASIQTATNLVTSTNPPDVTITFPTPGEVLTNQPFGAVGTITISSGQAAVSNLWIQVNNDGWYHPGSSSPSNSAIWYSFGFDLTPGSNRVQAYATDDAGHVSPTNTVTFAYVVTAGAEFAGPPGTPASGLFNPGGTFIVVSVGGGIGVQPITNDASQFGANATAFAGDVVFLVNTNNGTNPTNWAAVLRFINPSDPTGTNGLAATECETFYQTNASPGYFAGFSLLPNVDYVSIASTNVGVGISADSDLTGPAGDIIAGQSAIIFYTAAIQPGAPAVVITSPTPGEVVTNQVFYATGSVLRFGTSVGVSNVLVQLNGGAWQIAATGDNWTNWAAGDDALLPPGSNTVSAYLVDSNGVVSATNTVTFDYVFTPLGSVPGTPIAWTNPGGSVVITATLGFAGNPIPIQTGPGASTGQAGDLVLLDNTNGFAAANHWAAVVRFFNPADPTGTLGMSATYEQTFFATNFGGSGFNGYQLFPVVSYIPEGTVTTNANGLISFSTIYTQFGPAGGINAGQTDLAAVSLFNLTSAVNITSPTNGQVVSSAAFTVSGTTTNFIFTGFNLSAALTNVFVQLNGGTWTNATSVNGWTNWSANVTLTPGSNTVSAYAVDGYGSDSPTNTVTFDYSTGTGADLSLSAISGGGVTNVVGGSQAYYLTVSNAGPATASGVVISNQLPANETFYSVTGGATPTGGVLLVNLGSLAAGAVTNLTLIVYPTLPPGHATFQLTNQFRVFASTIDPVLTNNSATVVNTISLAIPGTPLTYIGSNPGGSVLVTAAYGFGIGPINDGPTTIPVFQTLTATPGDLILLNDPTGGNNPTNWVAVLRFFNPADPTGISTLAATESQTFFATNYDGSGFAGFQLFPNTYFFPAGSINTTNGVTSVIGSFTEFGPAGVFLAAQEDITIVTVISSYADLGLTASAAPQPVTVGSNLVYSITVTNQAGLTATGVVVSNRIPANCTFVSATGGATPASGVLVVNLGSLTNGAATNIQVTVQPTAAGSLTNNFEVFANEFDPDVTNNSAAVVSTVTNAAVVGAPVPGTPIAWTNPGSSILAVPFAGEAGKVISITNDYLVPTSWNFTTAEPGDVVMLLDPSGGDNSTNWAGLVRLFNPNDPTGSIGLAATEYETFFPTTAGPNGFTNFLLFPNVTYIGATLNSPVPGAISATPVELGPDGTISPGQEAEIVFVISPRTICTITAPVAGQQASNAAFTVTGTAMAGLPAIMTVTNVYVQLNGGGWTNATTVNGWTNWTANVTLTPGSNTVQAYAMDTYLGGISPTNPVTFDYATGTSPQADVSLRVTESPNPVNVLTTNLVTYSFIVSNAGPATATDVTVSNQLFTQGSPLDFNSATGGSTPTNGILLMNLGPLAPGATNVAQMTAYLIRNGPASFYTNTFQVYADQADPVPTNNFATVIFKGTNGNATLFSTSSAEYDSNTTTTVSQQVTNYSTELIAKLPNGTVVYDQKFTAAFSDPAVQAAITTAAVDLTNAGASAYTGPAQTSLLKTTNNSSVTIPVSTNITVISGTKAWVGPQTILVGNYGMVTGYTLDPVVTNYAIPTGGNPQSLTLASGQTDADTMVLGIFNIFQTTTNTATYTNSAVYTMTGVVPAASADLSLSGSALPQPVGVGSNLVYIITITNRGPSAATGVTVSNRIPANETFVSATGGATPSGGVLLVNLGPLATNASTTAQITVQPTTAGKLTNVFQVFATQTDPVLTNNSATVVSTVTNEAPLTVDVALSITAAPNPVGVGDPLTYSLTVTNNSSTTATGVVVSNTLPADVNLVSVLPSEGSVTNNAGVLTFDVGTLPHGIAATLAIVVVPEAAGLLTNSANASGAQTDSQPANNIVTNVTTAVTEPITNLVLTVLSAITLDPQTGLFEQRIQVSNGGPATPSSVLVLISGLAKNTVVYNASGTTNGVPYVQSASPLGVGSNIVFVLEYYVPNRQTPTNVVLTVEGGPPVTPPVVTGTILSISREVVLPNGSVLVEFSAIPDRIYAIQYSSDLVTWHTAVPVITAPANQVDWIDAGPPQTANTPAQAGTRYYRVVLLPAK